MSCGYGRLLSAPTFLRLSRKAIYALVWAGSLPYVRIGRRVRVPHQVLTAFIQDRLVAGPRCRGRRDAGMERPQIVAPGTQRRGVLT